MAVGDNALMGDLSYVGFGREITYGTLVTSGAGLNFLSASFKATKEVKILEEIQTSRTNSNQISLGKTIEGEMEFYFGPRNNACNYILQNAFGGGPVTTATATGETAGGLGFSHTVNIANFDKTYSSLCVNIRKGDSTTGKVFAYSGLRVNELTFSAEIDEALLVNASFVGKDATNSATDVASLIDTSTQAPLSFVNGRFSVEGSAASLTSTSFWHVQSMEFVMSNNLLSDSGSRRSGSDTIQVLPAGLATFELKATLRFDTTTAFDAMMANTRLAGEFEFVGDTMGTSIIREGIKITMPHLRIMDAGDPEISGPNEMLTSEVTFAVLRDGSSGGYAVRAVVTNNTSSYA
jgi:hypothetical protein